MKRRVFAAVILWALSLMVAARSTFTELSAADQTRLDKQRAVVSAALRDRYGLTLTGTPADLRSLQRLLDDGVFSRNQSYELQSLGVALGDVLLKSSDLRWVIVSDEYGTDPTLRYKQTTIQVNALTVISKRVEDGEPVDVHAIYDGLRKHLADLLRSGQYE